MDLSKHTLPESDTAALMVATDFVGKRDHVINAVEVTGYPGYKGVEIDFATTLRIHQELIEALESSGFSVIDGTVAVMRAMLQQAENLAVSALYPEGERKAVIMYQADWVQAASSKHKTVMVDYHVLVGLVKPGTNILVNKSSVGVCKFPLTQGVEVHDYLFDLCMNDQDGPNDDDKDDEEN